MIFNGRVHKSLAEASPELGFSVWYLRKLCRLREIPFQAYGKKFFVDVDVCKKALQERAQRKTEVRAVGHSDSRSIIDLI